MCQNRTHVPKWSASGVSRLVKPGLPDLQCSQGPKCFGPRARHRTRTTRVRPPSSTPDGNMNCTLLRAHCFERTLAVAEEFVEIRFISSLTPEDEDAIASVLLTSVRAILDNFPIAYTVRIETATARVFQHTSAADPTLAHGTRSLTMSLPRAGKDVPTLSTQR